MVTDKMPANYEYLGYIFSMFPNCKVINTKRDPIDTCLSIFFQNFHSGHKYAFDLDNLVIWYKEYDRLMNHWLSLFDEKILTLKNLNLVSLDHNELEFLHLKGLLGKELIKPLYLS